MKQTIEQKKYILENLPKGVKRVQILTAEGKQSYVRPDEIDLERDEIVLSQDGRPVVMKGKPGRKKKPVLNPATPQIAQVCQARNEHISEDSLSGAVLQNSESDAVLDAILAGMAEDRDWETCAI